METEKLKSIINQVQEAVKDITDEALKKIAFQKILDTLMTPHQTQNQSVHVSPQSIPTQSGTPILGKLNQDLPANISEFVHGQNQKSHFNIVTSMAYYFHFKGDGDFNIEGIQDAYGKCLIPKPKNITDIINQNIRKSLIIKADKPKNGKQAYHITKQGIEYVNSNFILKPKSSYNPKKTKETKSDGKDKK